MTTRSVISAGVVDQIIEQILGIVISAGIGFARRWRPHLGSGHATVFVGFTLLGLSAFTWFGFLLGVVIRSSDVVQGIDFAIMLPSSFLEGTLVSIAGMKLVPRAIAEWGPSSAPVAVVRYVCPGTSSSRSLQLNHPIFAMAIW